jgi:heat shock protein HtpX
VYPLEPEPPKDIFESLYAAAGRRLGKGLLDEMLQAKSLKPRWTLSKVLAFALAALVNALTLALVVVGVWLGAAGWPNVFALFGALLCLLIAWLLRPRFPKLRVTVASRDEFPVLYKITDEMAKYLGESGAQDIVVGEGFYAAFTQVGWQRRKVMYLGLPLLAILDAQEKVALIAHELAHGVNGDPNRSLVIGAATSALGEWYGILYPDFSGWRLLGVEAIFLIPINVLRAALAGLAWLGAFVLTHLLLRDMQRAEYLADALAADVGGSEAMASMLEKHHLHTTFRLTVQRMALGNRDVNFVEELRRNLAQVPARELERIRRVMQLEDSKLYVTHPPTAYRIRLLKNRPASRPRIMLSPSDLQRLERELEAARPKIQGKLVDSYLVRIS